MVGFGGFDVTAGGVRDEGSVAARESEVFFVARRADSIVTGLECLAGAIGLTGTFAMLGIILLASTFKLATNGSNASKPNADTFE